MTNMPLCSTFSCISLFLCAAVPALAKAEVRRISEYTFAAGDGANGDSLAAAQSADGRFLAFATVANNLQAGIADDDGWHDIVVLDRQTGAFDYVSLEAVPGPSGNGSSWDPDISDDGRWVFFTSGSANLIPGLSFPSPSSTQAYLFDRQTRAFQLVSHAPDNPTVAADRAAYGIALSADGRFALVQSAATNLAAGGAGNSVDQVYLFDRASGELQLVSHAAGAPALFGNAVSRAIGLSDDGRFLLLQSSATNLVAGLADGFGDDVFVYDRVAASAELISRSAANPLATTGGTAGGLSPDGRFVLVDSVNVSMAAGATDGNGSGTDVFLFDRQSGSAELVSRTAGAPATSGNQLSLGGAFSANGRYVYYSSRAGNLVTPFTDGNAGGSDVFLFDRQKGSTTLVSHSAGSATQSGNAHSQAGRSSRSISPDGRFLLYASQATNLENGVQDGNAEIDLYRYDRQAGSSTLVSRIGSTLAAGTGEIGYSVVGASGEVVFSSRHPLDPTAFERQDGIFDLYRFESGSVELLSATPLDGAAALGALDGALGADGRFLAWNGFLFDRRSGENQLIGHAAGAPGAPANGWVDGVALTTDGRYVVLEAAATDLAAGITDRNDRLDVYLYDRGLETATLLSHRAGSPSQTGSGGTVGAGFISADGNLVALRSTATDLVAGQSGPPNQLSNLFLYDRQAGTAEVVSHHHASLTETSEKGTDLLDASPDGRFLLYLGSSLFLVPGFVDHNGQEPDLYLYDRTSRQSTLVSHLPGLPAEGAPTTVYQAALVAGNSAVFYTAWSSTPSLADPKIYRWDRATNTSQPIQPGTPLLPCNDNGILADLSPDGRWLLFTTTCAFVPGDGNGSYDVYLFDSQEGQLRLISHLAGDPASASGGVAADLSADVLRAVFWQTSPAGPGGPLYSYDLASQQALLLTTAYFDRNLPVTAQPLAASGDGSVVLAWADDGRMAPYDANDSLDIFLIAVDGELFADGFESGDTTAWSLTVP